MSKAGKRAISIKNSTASNSQKTLLAFRWARYFMRLDWDFDAVRFFGECGLNPNLGKQNY